MHFWIFHIFVTFELILWISMGERWITDGIFLKLAFFRNIVTYILIFSLTITLEFSQ